MFLFVLTCLLSFYLNSRKKYKLSIYVAAYFPLLISCLAIFFLGPQSGIEYICIAMLAIPFMLFKSLFERVAFIVIAFILLNIALFLTIQFPWFTYDVDLSRLRIITFIGAVVFLVLTYKIQDDVSNEHININKKLSESYKEKNKELQRFVYAASHDLKEPLRTIGSYTQLLKRQLDGKFDENAEEYFNFVNQGVNQMQSLLQDLLDYGKIGTDNIPIQEVNLNDLLLVVKNNLQLKIQESNASIFINELPTIKANKTMLIRLFQNLIDNALKFKKEDQDSKINLWHASTTETLNLYVKDNGIGIPTEYKDTIFEIFTRLHARSQYDGSGIGLATCFKITQIFKGRLDVDSTVGKGTTFIIKFPISIVVPA